MSSTSPVYVFSAIAFALTWSIGFWIYFKFGTVDIGWQQHVYHSLASLGPAIAAIITSYLYYGWPGVSKLLNRLKISKIHLANTYRIAFAPLVLFIVGVLIYPLIKGEWFDFDSFAITYWHPPTNAIIWLLPLISYAIFEELGWRGFLLPHLQEKYNAWTSTIYLTVIWATWHIPFFFYRFDFSLFISIGFFFGLFVGGIILTSLYNAGRGSLIPVILFHLLMNICSGFDKEIIVAIMSMGYVFIALYIIRHHGKDNLSLGTRTMNYFKDPL